MRNIIALLIISLFLLSSCAGKDTDHTFSDPDIQIMKFYNSNWTPPEKHSLFIVSEQKTIEVDVYECEEKGGNIYSIGENGYTVLNVESKEYKQSRELNDFNMNDIEQFTKLKQQSNH
jgi:hypothetical protein